MKIQGYIGNCPVGGEVINIINAEKFIKDSQGNPSKIPCKIYQVQTCIGVVNLEEQQVVNIIQ